MQNYKPKVIIYGGNGWIGKKFTNILNDNWTIHISSLRANNYASIKEELINIMPNNVLCCIGRTHGDKINTIDYLELPGNLQINLRDNLEGPINIANICHELNIHMTYIGTGCIFDYTNQKNYNDVSKTQYYSENDYPDFFGSSYSIVKGKTDNILRNFNNVLNCRIRMPIDSTFHHRNFITKITKYDKICNMNNSMTVLDEIIPIIKFMMSKKTTGTYNLTNPGYINHNKILDMYIEIVDKNFTYKNFTINEQNKLLLSKRSNNVLDTTKLERFCKLHSLKLNNIQISVENTLNTMSLSKNMYN